MKRDITAFQMLLPLGPERGFKGLPNTHNKEVCSTTCVAPRVCTVDFVLSQPHPQGVVVGGKRWLMTFNKNITKPDLGSTWRQNCFPPRFLLLSCAFGRTEQCDRWSLQCN